jgi:transcriptional regulator with XRE-family HTH domain
MTSPGGAERGGTLPEVLRAAREAGDLSVRDAASAAGLSRGHYQRLEGSEGGVTAPSIPTLRKLAEGLGVPLDDLIRAVHS